MTYSKDLGLTYSQVGVLMAWSYFTSVFLNLSGGIIVDMVGKTGFLLGLLITSLLLVILVLLKLKFLFIAVPAFLGFFLFSMRPVIFAWTMDLAPKDISGTVVSALFGIQSLFSSLAPAICGLIADRYGILSSFYFLSFTVFTANFLVYLIPKKPPAEEVISVPQV